jgi:hypothetical protein
MLLFSFFSIWMLLCTRSLTFVRALSATSFRSSSNSRPFVASLATTLSATRTPTRLHSTMAEEVESSMTGHNNYPLEMTDDEKYLFDLNGYLIVRGVLTPEEVKVANGAIDNHAHEMVERSEGALRNAVEGTKFFGEGPGRKDLGRALEWGEESRVFQSILAHPRLVPVFHGILGKGYRMDHLPIVLAQNQGSEGFQLHGGTG